jgi:tetratricopeptide (TPR) repeat protein
VVKLRANFGRTDVLRKVMPGFRGIFLASLAACALVAAPLSATGSKSEEGVRLFEARRLAEARSVLEEAVAEDAGDARAASYLGRVLLADGEVDRAVAWLEKSVALEDSNAEYHLWLGRAYGSAAIRASVLKQPSLARKVKKEFERASQLDPDSLEARFGLIEFYLRAPGVLGGSRKKADEQAREIRKRNALQGYRAFGRIAEQEKDFDQAFREYLRAAAEFPEQVGPSYWIGALHARNKDYAKAFEVYEKLLERDPRQTAACYQIGRVAVLSGQRLERGEECLKLYLQHDPLPDEPTLASAHYRLGLLYEKKGSRDLARREYSAALALEPSYPEAREALKKIS